MIYIKLKNCCFFFFEFYFEAPKMYTNQLNNICNEAAKLQLYQRYASVQVIFNVFSQICSVVICKENFRDFTNFSFPENLLVAAANRFKVLKTFISLKIREYMQNRRLRSERALDA